MAKIYVKNSEFLELLRKFEETKDRKIYEKLGKIFMLIAQNFLNKPWFINYTDDRKDEMISDAYYCMIKYRENFDLSKNNPFAYFTMIAHNAFLQNIKKYKLRQEKYISLDLTETLDYSQSTIMMGE